MPLPDGWVVGDLLVEDTFTRADSGALGSTEGGLLGPLAWSVTGTGVGVASNAAQVDDIHAGRAALTLTGRTSLRVEATIVAEMPSSFAGSAMSIFARGSVHNGMLRTVVTGYRPRMSMNNAALWLDQYTGASFPRGVLRLDVIGDEAWAEYLADSAQPGHSGSDGPRPLTDPVDWTVGIWWDANRSDDVLRWLDFRVWELKPEHEGGWQLGSVGWGTA